nr:TPA_asm: hypothetical protein [Corynactis coral adintovirus]
MPKRRKVIDFNHVDPSTPEYVIDELKELYKHYHAKFTKYKMLHRHFKAADMACMIGSSLLIVAGTITGAVTLNPIVLGSITGAGMVLQTYSQAKGYKRKAELCRFAYTTYQGVLVELRSHIRGVPYDQKDMLCELRTLDKTIIDTCPAIPESYHVRYETVFNSEDSLNVVTDKRVDTTPPIPVPIQRSRTSRFRREKTVFNTHNTK